MKTIFLAITMLFLVSCGTVTTPVSPENTTAEHSSAMTGEDILGNMQSVFQTNENYKSCVKQNIDMCTQELSYEEGNTLGCDDYLLETNVQACKENKIIETARASGDISLCAGLSDNKETCEYEILTAKGLEENNPSACDPLGDELQIRCNNSIVFAQAYAQKDISICDNLREYLEGDTMEKEMCTQEITYILEEQKLQEETLAEQE